MYLQANLFTIPVTFSGYKFQYQTDLMFDVFTFRKYVTTIPIPGSVVWKGQQSNFYKYILKKKSIIQIARFPRQHWKTNYGLERKAKQLVSGLRSRTAENGLRKQFQ